MKVAKLMLTRDCLTKKNGWYFVTILIPFYSGEEFTGKCISDPSRCHNGVTIAIWVQLSRPISGNQTSFAFIFSSGGQSSRGCAIYVVGSNRLRATVADGSKEWIVELNFDTNKGILFMSD